VIDADGTYLGKYRKMHIPDDPAYYEKFYFTPVISGIRLENQIRQIWSIDLLGSMVSGGSANYIIDGGGDFVLSNCYRLGHLAG
jgi:predicted amidohydrolase